MSLSSLNKISQKKKSNSAFNPVKKAVYRKQNKLRSKMLQADLDEPYYSNEQNNEAKNTQLQTPIKKDKMDEKQNIQKTKKISKKQRSSTSFKQQIIVQRQNIQSKPLYNISSPIKVQQFLPDPHSPLQPILQFHQSPHHPILKKSRKVHQQQMFFSQQFNHVTQIDFQIMFRLNTIKKMYSTILLSQNGEIIFVDRLGSELFQGSLNNLQRNPIQSIILKCRLRDFIQKTKKITKQHSQIIKLVIYSKNSKRRYSKVSNTNLISHEDIYNRYLKSISAKIMPIQISFKDYQKYEGFWKKELVENHEPLKCYLMRARLSKNLPDLEEFDFQNDKKIMKFIDYTKRKHETIESGLISVKQQEISQENQQEQYQPQNQHQNYPQQQQQDEDYHDNHGYQTPQHNNKKRQCSFENFKEYIGDEKQVQNQLIDMVRNDKSTISAMTRGGLLGSASGKEGRETNNIVLNNINVNKI